MDVVIRRGRIEDGDALQRIAVEAYAPYIPLIEKKPAPMTADYAAHLREDEVFVATEDGEDVMGFAILLRKNGEIWLENIAVGARCAGRGVGGALLAHVEASLAGRAPRLLLYTNVVMTRNIAWYARCGYRETGRRVDEGYERVFFEKDLPLAPA